MVDQLYTNARTDTYKHPSRYVRAAVGIGRGARSGWVELGWRMGRSGATRPQIGGGVRAISSGNREGCAQRMGRIGVADGSERDNEWGRLGRRMGRSGTADGSNWGGGWVGAEQRALTSGAGAPLFGEIDTYGRGRPLESKPPPEGCTLRIGIPWLIDRNTEIALSVRRNCFIRTQELLYSCAGIALSAR